MDQINKVDSHSEFYTKKLQVILTKRDKISHDSYLFRFDFKNPKERLGMLVTQHILIYGENLKKEIVSRKYTAVVDEEGYFLIPIKIYRPNVHPNFPEGGELTPWLEQIELNTELTVKRCIGKLLYVDQKFILKPKLNQVPTHFTTVFMVCGGSGITPAYQLIMSICNNQNDNTQISLLYANRTEEDIWLRKELEHFQENNKHKFQVHYTLDNPPENWKGFKGHVTLEMLKSIFPNPSEQTLGVLCGPKPMNKLVIQLYQDFGVKKENILKF